MNTIKLSNKTQDKLIELCNLLFPEYLASYGALPNGMMVFRKHDSKEYEYAHWYEFCTNILMREIWIKLVNKVQEKFDHTYGKYFTFIVKQGYFDINVLYDFVKLSIEMEGVNLKQSKNEKTITNHRTAILC